MFSEKGRGIIAQALKRTRWIDFNTVVDRLNAPELVAYYEKTHFYYKNYRSGEYNKVTGEWESAHHPRYPEFSPY